MKLTPIHLQFWLWHKAPIPVWGTKLTIKIVPPSVDAVVNANAGLSVIDRRLEAHNTLVLLSLARKRGDLVAKLQSLAAWSGGAIKPTRRAAYCRKWLARIEKEKTCFPPAGK